MGEFEMLFGERDADYGYAKQDTEKNVGKKDPDATYKQPDNIHQRRKTTGLARPGSDFSAERPQFKQSELK